MSQLEVDKIIPQSETTLTIGETGDTINFGSGVLPNFENLTVTGDLTVDTNSLYVDSTNNYVGIGTATPSSVLHIVNSSPLIKLEDSDVSLSSTISGNSGNIYLNTASSNRDIIIQGSSTEVARITGDGFVGIGTSSPSTPLHISTSAENVATFASTDTGARIVITDGTDTGYVNVSNSSGTGIISIGQTLGLSPNNLNVDDSGNVGIGTTSPTQPLMIYKSGSNANLLIQSHNSTPGSYNQASLNFALSSSASATLNWDINAEQTALTFDYEGSEAMRIDSSGNVLVGKTTANTTDLGNVVYAGIVSASMSGDPAIFANRSQDGSIIELQQSGTTVGSIGVNSDRLYIGDSTYGTIAFANGYNAIFPAGSGGSPSGGTHDLGSSSARWKDFYLSGNIYLGGTGSANALDDYEEGTWTPAFSRASSAPTVTHSRQSGTYSKIGQTVIAFFDMVVDSYSGGGGDYRMVGLPFTTNMNATNGGFSRSVIRNATLMSSDFRVYGDSSFVNASNVTLKNYNSSGTEVAVSPSSSGRLTGYIIYTTNA